MDAVSTSTSASLNDAIDALPVTDVADTTTTDTGAETAPPEIDAPVDPAAEAQPETTEDAPAAEDAPPEHDELDPADPLDPDKISPDGKQYFFRESKAKQLLAARDFKKAVEQSLGPDATVDNIAEMYRRTAGLDQMLSDLQSGEAARVADVVEELLRDNAPDVMGVFADSVMARISSAAPQQYATISNRVIGGYANHLYQQALRSGDESLFKLAQNLDFRLSGKFRTQEQMSQRDPMADERQRFEQERQQFYDLRQKEQARTTQQAVAQAEAAADGAVTEEISKALAPIMASLKALPNGAGDIHLRHIQRDLTEEVEKAVNANSAWGKKYQIALDQVKRNPTAESRERLVTMVRQFAAPVIARTKGAVITAITGNVLGQNAAAHAKQAAIAERRETAGTNNPVRRPGIDQKLADLKKQGYGAREGLEAIFGGR